MPNCDICAYCGVLPPLEAWFECEFCDRDCCEDHSCVLYGRVMCDFCAAEGSDDYLF